MEGLVASCFFRIIFGAVIGYLTYKLVCSIIRTTISMTLVTACLANGIVLGYAVFYYPHYLAFDVFLRSIFTLAGLTFGYWLGARKKSQIRKHEA